MHLRDAFRKHGLHLPILPLAAVVTPDSSIWDFYTSYPRQEVSATIMPTLFKICGPIEFSNIYSLLIL